MKNPTVSKVLRALQSNVSQWYKAQIFEPWVLAMIDRYGEDYVVEHFIKEVPIRVKIIILRRNRRLKELMRKRPRAYQHPDELLPLIALLEEGLNRYDIPYSIVAEEQQAGPFGAWGIYIRIPATHGHQFLAKPQMSFWNRHTEEPEVLYTEEMALADINSEVLVLHPTTIGVTLAKGFIEYTPPEEYVRMMMHDIIREWCNSEPNAKLYVERKEKEWSNDRN